MARPAPAVDRAVAVLNHLAAYPERTFTLSALAQELGINKATAHALLAALVDAGYLIRDDGTKNYTLGATLIALGNAASLTNPAARLALPYMERLTADLDVECVASTAIHDEIVILTRAGTPRPFSLNAHPGQRLPLAPPLGAVFVAWANAEAVERWLAHLGPGLTEAELKPYRRALEFVRERGYSVGLGPAAVVGDEEYVLTDLVKASYEVHHIGAPVFDPDGRVVLELIMFGFRDTIAREDMPRYAERLCQAAEEVSKALA